MGRRNLVDIDNKILDAVMHIGGQRGVAAVSAQKVAALCDISHFTCFNHFGTMRGMLDAAAMKYRGMFFDALDEKISEGKDLRQIWDEMLDFFLQDSEKALYFRNYVIMYSHDLAKNEEWVSTMSARVTKLVECSSEIDSLMAFDYALTVSLHYVNIISRGMLEDSPDSRELIRTFAFSGMDGVTAR